MMRMTYVQPPRVLSIQSEVAYGHVGNSGARFALMRLGVETMSAPTVFFSNHPGHDGFRGKAFPADDLAELTQGLEERGFLKGVDAVITGYLGAPEQALVARDAALAVKRANPQAVYLLDPVFGDDDGAYARPGVAEAMARHLLPLADIVTPNRFELASLTSRRIETAADARDAARLLGRPLVLATSTPVGEGLIGTLAVTPDAAWLVTTRRVDSPPSGTGDLLAALFLGWRLKGGDVPDALASAVESVDEMIAATKAAGFAEMPLAAMQHHLVDPEIAEPPQAFA